MVLIVVLLMALIGVVAIKLHSQRYKDHNRRTYKVSFPAEMTTDQVVNWIRSISGTLKGHPFSLMGSATVAFELYATTEGIQHYIRVPYGLADYVIPQLRAHIPGIRVTHGEYVPRREWTRLAEVGLKNSSHELRIPSPAAPALGHRQGDERQRRASGNVRRVHQAAVVILERFSMGVSTRLLLAHVTNALPHHCLAVIADSLAAAYKLIVKVRAEDLHLALLSVAVIAFALAHRGICSLCTPTRCDIVQCTREVVRQVLPGAS